MSTTQPGTPATSRHVSVRQAAFIGVGAMVGAGIFSLLGAPGRSPAPPSGSPS